MRLRLLTFILLVVLLAASAVWAQLVRTGDAASILRIPPSYGHGPGLNGDGPLLGSLAPDFLLPDSEGTLFRLSKFRGRLVVLAIGSYTCDFFESAVGQLDYIKRKFGDKVVPLIVYTEEAHAADGRPDPHGDKDREIFISPKTLDQRRTAACKLVSRLSLKAPVLLDTMQNKVFRDYGVASARLYVIDADGRVAYKSTQSPTTFRPSDVDPVLVRLNRRLR